MTRRVEGSGVMVIRCELLGCGNIICVAVWSWSVLEWWDMNMAPLADADSERTLLVALMEELRPALVLAKVFVRV